MAADERFEHIEALVNSAGGEKDTGTKLVDFERSDWDFTMNLDLTSIFTMCKKVGGGLFWAPKRRATSPAR